MCSNTSIYFVGYAKALGSSSVSVSLLSVETGSVLLFEGIPVANTFGKPIPSMWQGHSR